MKFKINFFTKSIISCILSLITSLLYYTYVQSELKTSILKLECILISSQASTVELYLDYDIGFNEYEKISINLSHKDSLALFTIDNKTLKTLKRLRLDFNPQNNTLLLKKINFYKDDKKWFSLDKDNLDEKISFVSEKNSMIKSGEGVIVSTKTNDFYISFVDMFNLITSNFIKSILLLWPWILFFGIFILSELRAALFNKDYLYFSISLFVLSLFLKEACSTFAILLIGGVGIYNFYKGKRLRFHYEQIALIIFFLFILVFGKIVSYKQINVQLGLLIIPLFLAFNNKIINKHKLYLFFCNVFLVFMNILITSFIISVFVYNETDLLVFFETKKTILGNITYWVVYDNATFLSFFILLGTIFSEFLFSKKQINRYYYLIFMILSLISIYILGSRIALVTYFILLFTNKISIKWISAVYIVIFFCIYSFIYININSFDNYRSIIWEKTLSTESDYLLGNGLGTSEELFSNFENQYISENINHPHNQYITYKYELGILGIILLVCLFIYYGILYFYKNEKDRLVILFLLSILMITESPFETSKPLLLFAFFISIQTESDFIWKLKNKKSKSYEEI